jgi:hypothetical protein
MKHKRRNGLPGDVLSLVHLTNQEQMLCFLVEVLEKEFDKDSTPEYKR